MAKIHRWLLTPFIIAISSCAIADPFWYSTRRALSDPGFTTTPIEDQEAIGQEILKRDKERPWFTTLCLPLSGLDVKRYERKININGYQADDDRIAWDHLVRLGLAYPPTKTKTDLVYRLTPAAKQALTDDKCFFKADQDFTSPGTLSLVYGRYSFAKFHASAHFAFGNRPPDGYMVYSRSLADLADWANDKDFRRAWSLPGLADLERTAWCYNYAITSNGVELQRNAKCG
ncbi:MAG TPA: hypothetical protein VJ576_01065 [Rhodocyclaceae bacterium]|nr:hypothetical protein [Rhodocyclaceae bacterium]